MVPFRFFQKFKFFSRVSEVISSLSGVWFWKERKRHCTLVSMLEISVAFQVWVNDSHHRETLPVSSFKVCARCWDGHLPVIMPFQGDLHSVTHQGSDTEGCVADQDPLMGNIYSRAAYCVCEKAKAFLGLHHYFFCAALFFFSSFQSINLWLIFYGLPWWISGREPACQCKRLRFNPWVRMISWRKKLQLTPVFLPGKSHGQRSLADYSPRGCKRAGHNLATKQQYLTL